MHTTIFRTLMRSRRPALTPSLSNIFRYYSTQKLRLEGKVAVITGADSGIGQGIALAYANEGCDVAINYHTDKEGAEKTAEGVKKAGRKAFISQGDVGSESYVKELIEHTVKQFGHLDIMVNNAGVPGEQKPVHELSFEDFQKVISTNLFGTFLGSKYAAIQMLKQSNKGSIINISSIHEDACTQNASAYCSSKGGIKNLMKSQASELAPHGIRINNIAPGMILTPMNQKAMDDKNDREKKEKQIPLRRAGVPEDIAGMAVFLASEEASYCTGSTYFVDGGWMLTQPQKCIKLVMRML